MTKIVNASDEDREIPSLNLFVAKGETVDVPDDAVEGLLCQTDNWKPAKGAKETDK